MNYLHLRGAVIAAVAGAFICGHAAESRADVTLAGLFGDHAVLQRDRPLPVWGWAEPGEKVKVKLGKESASVVADEQGNWLVRLGAQPVSNEPQELVVEGKNKLVVADVLLGDVWICGGQSNMEWSLGGCDVPEEIQSADLPKIRHFRVTLNFATTPQKDVVGNWQPCSPQTASGITAVGFYFARRVQGETDVPIGLLQSCCGGTNIELWMSEATLLNTPELSDYAKLMRDSLEKWRGEIAERLPAVDAWSAAVKTALAKDEPIPAPPLFPEYPFGERMFRPRCVTLYNGMIAPIAPFAVKGFLWYQGENNAGSAADVQHYTDKMAALIRDWREYFGDGEALPFYFVQLAPWQAAIEDPAGGQPWALMREAQLAVLAKVPATGMAVTLDVGDAADIHPRNKFDVGDRLARWALAEVYGKKIEPSGPLFRELQIEGNEARVQFDHVGAGLMVGRKEGREPAKEIPSAALARFAIAGDDQVWRWADARIEGDEVVCTNPETPRPVAIRYGFSMNPAGANLYNRDGLPASPFRTDNW